MSDVQGLSELNKQLSNLQGIKTSKALLKGCYVLQKYSMENAPVKTGFLRNSMTSEETKDGAEMRVATDYAIYVEFGTSVWEGHPFVRPAIDEHSDEIVKAVADEIQDEIKGVIK
jgi:HK97 gp10 family phage protein